MMILKACYFMVLMKFSEMLLASVKGMQQEQQQWQFVSHRRCESGRGLYRSWPVIVSDGHLPGLLTWPLALQFNNVH
jgi:hypothetical protein